MKTILTYISHFYAFLFKSSYRYYFLSVSSPFFFLLQENTPTRCIKQVDVVATYILYLYVWYIKKKFTTSKWLNRKKKVI